MIALRDKWTPTSRLFSRVDEGQPRKFVLDCGIAWQNYLDGNGVFQEINLTPQPSDIVGYNWMVPGLPFKPYLATNGARRIFVDRNSQARRIDFPASKFLANKTFTKVGNSLVWSSNAYDVIMRWENSRVKFDVVVKRNIPFDQVQFDVDKTGLTDAELLAFMSNLTATDSSPEPIVRKLDVFLVAGVLTIGFDLTGMTLPVTIDPTLDLQVGAGADDGYYAQVSGTDYQNGVDFLAIGDSGGTDLAAWMRLTGVSGLSGATINVSYITFQKNSTNFGTTILTKLRTELANAPAAPTTAADARSRTLTTAGVDWDTISGANDTPIDSPSLNSVFQELADTYNPTVIQVFWLDDGSADSSYVVPWSYNGSTIKAVKLHIEYTAGGVTFVPRLMVV